jgi:hypothetical protein
VVPLVDEDLLAIALRRTLRVGVRREHQRVVGVPRVVRQRIDLLLTGHEIELREADLHDGLRPLPCATDLLPGHGVDRRGVDVLGVGRRWVVDEQGAVAARPSLCHREVELAGEGKHDAAGDIAALGVGADSPVEPRDRGRRREPGLVRELLDHGLARITGRDTLAAERVVGVHAPAVGTLCGQKAALGAVGVFVDGDR